MQGLIAVVVFVLLGAAAATESYDRGFNSRIAWTNNLGAALQQAQSSGKPAFVLIHKTW